MTSRAVAGLLILALSACGTTALEPSPESTVAAIASTTAELPGEPGTALCGAIDVITDVVSPAWAGMGEGTLDLDQGAATMGAAAAQLYDLAEQEPNPEARQDIEDLAQNATFDQLALEAGDVFGGGDSGLMGDIIIKWRDRDFRCP